MSTQPIPQSEIPGQLENSDFETPQQANRRRQLVLGLLQELTNKVSSLEKTIYGISREQERARYYGHNQQQAGITGALTPSFTNPNTGTINHYNTGLNSQSNGGRIPKSP